MTKEKPDTDNVVYIGKVRSNLTSRDMCPKSAEEGAPDALVEVWPQFSDALRACEEAIRLEPDYANARHSLGFVYEGLGRISIAIEQYRKALELDPDLVAARQDVKRLEAM